MKMTTDLFDEIEVTAWILVAALLALILMFGHTLWRRIAADPRETTPGSPP
jgi:hypothetical protein